MAAQDSISNAPQHGEWSVYVYLHFSKTFDTTYRAAPLNELGHYDIRGIDIRGISALIARFMGPTWGPSGADRTQVGPMLALWTLPSG